MRQKRILPRIMWFVLLWSGSVVALFIASFAIKLLMSMAGLRSS
ncbi:hypothetical protein ACUY4R_000792 [Kosakonia sp. BK9b]|nr:DUF2474 domain-containing protein [Kosakonia sp.]